MSRPFLFWRSFTFMLLGTLPVPSVVWAQASSNDNTSLETVTVIGEATARGDIPVPVFAGGQVAAGARVGTWGQRNAADVPFNVIGFTAELIDNQQAETLADVLINDASVQSGYGYGNYAEKFQIRGFELDGEDIAYGGLYGVLPRQVVATNIAERVELFKGANAFANGVSPSGSGVGGAINIEPKRAADAPLNRLTTGVTDSGYVQSGIELGRRFGDEHQFGVRASIERGRGEVAIDDEERRATSAVVGLDYRGERGRASLDIGHQAHTVNGGRPVVRVGAGLMNIPDAPSAGSNYAPEWVNTELKTNFAMLRGEYEVANSWTAYAALGGSDTRESGMYATPVVNAADGSATIGQMEVPYRAESIGGQAGLRGAFDTGAVSHQLDLGYSSVYRTTRSAYEMASPGLPTNIYQPTDVSLRDPVFAGGDMNNPNLRSRTRNNGVSLSDTLGFLDDRLLLTLGARYQEVDVSNYDYDGNFDTNFSDTRLSPVYGVVVKPTDSLSLYANHIEALQPGDTAPTTAVNAGQSIGLVEAEQNEIGAKLDLGNLGGSLSLFEIEQPNAFIDPETSVYGYYGEQRNRGVELSVYGEPLDGLRLLSSAMWIDPELTRTDDGTNQGNDSVGVPGYRLVLGSEWDIPQAPGWTLSGRAVRNGSQYLDAANQLEVGAWTRWDLGVRYAMPLNTNTLTLRANIENLTDENYWASATGGYLTQGEPRTVKLSASLDF
ncbi:MULTISPECIES: TonB-dependent siderophore receptor [unclassified Halomonas]|uniref:TonB-dependent receptor n=1 Tax=unclassified Halomonas TaxID=2609666 RepID=UPI0007DA25DE|nr:MULTISPECIES: TonB-dependent siderophore receptor [unclassified Halomonas]MBT2787087.1 TonB-dependent siderophore receptor [Halomonas sp. ISL-106]MBT2795429.1 TonB-dependent siderophore receptor [Halomonas sp. ISL-104]OAL57936.1 TonB-dependent receptor [Halomonas sp. ALS9]